MVGRVWTEERRAKQAATIAARNAVKETVADTLVPAPEKKSSTVTVTYRPFDGDPHTTIWNHIKFHANIPVVLDRNNRAHQIDQLLPQRFAGAHGEVLTKHAPSLVFMGDLARANPSFEVDGRREKRKHNSRIVPPAGHEWLESHEGEISESAELDKVD